MNATNVVNAMSGMTGVSRIRSLSAAAVLLVVAAPGWASVTVNTPVNNAQVTSPFTLSAVATSCSSQAVTSIGYALDSSPDTTVVNGTSVEASVSVAPGQHVVHVQAWTDSDLLCDTDIAITVTPSAKGPMIPQNAISVSEIQALSNWKGQHDTGGKGRSSGSTVLVNSPSQSGTARTFLTKYENAGDERYSVTFGDDADATNFLYDAWVYFDQTAGSVANLEMDINQVMPNGDNAIFAFQCAGDSQTWDYSENAGTPKKSKVKWVPSNQYCNPRMWTIDTWHHVQIGYSRDENGNVTYQAVWLDGAEQVINQTVPSMFALGWPGGRLQTQFQVDGSGKSGKTSVYLDNLTIYRW